MRDYGAGLTVDELVGLTALQITHLSLPADEVFRTVKTASNIMVENNLESNILLELWEDGHTVWKDLQQDRPVVVTPTGQVLRKKG